MEKMILSLVAIIIMSIVGYRHYSRAQVAFDGSLSFRRMAEESESYNTLSNGIAHEPERRIKTIRDSIQAINQENYKLTQLVATQRGELKLLRDSLNNLNANMNAYLDVKLRDLNERFEKFKETELGRTLEENSRLTEENRNKDEQIYALQQQLLQKEEQIDSLNQVIIDKNSHILALTNKIQELQQYITRVNAKLPQTFKAIEAINSELLKIHVLLDESTVFNRKRRMEEARAGIGRIISMYEELNKVYETEYFNTAISELAQQDERLKP